VTPIKRVLSNFRVLALGRVGASILNLGAVTIMARALSLADFGTVVLVFVYLMTIRVLANIKPFLAIIRWGVPALDKDDRGTLAQLLVLTKRIDYCAALTATLMGLLLAPLIGPLLGWSETVIGYTMVFSSVLLTSGAGTATGFLRLTDRFDTIATAAFIGPAIRLSGALVAWLQGLPIDTFLAIWCISLGAESGYLVWRGRRECLAHNFKVSIFDKTSLEPFKGLPRFLCITYIQTLLDLVPHRFATLMVGAALGAESAGLFRVASELYTVLARPAVLLRQVVFPDLTRLWTSNRSTFRHVVIRICGIAGLIGLSFVIPSFFFGDWLMATVFGEQFRIAGELLTWLLVAATFELGGAALRPAGYAIDRSGAILTSHVISTLIFVFSFYFLLNQFGLTGSGMAVALGAMLVWLGMVYVVIHKTRFVHEHDSHHT